MAPFARSFSSPLSRFHQWWSSLSIHSLGTIWQSHNVEEALVQGDLVSKPAAAGPSLRLCFRNATPIPLILCWMSESGKPHHFYTLKPQFCRNEDLVNVISVENHHHVETTKVGHAFCIAAECTDEDVQKRYLNPSCIIGGYRPMKRGSNDSDGAVHVVTITLQKEMESGILCCNPWGLRGAHHKTNDKDDQFLITVTQGRLDPTPLDTTNKHYEETTLGGWPVRVEQNWDRGNPKLRQRLENDLQYACDHLPRHAREYLQSNTPIYINRSQKYGPKVCPVNGKGLCFHPCSKWLCGNGMSPSKCECIELYNTQDYLEDCEYWGPGGVFLHELSHAFHWKMCFDGYQNKDIAKCYQHAMRSGLYQSVEVHSKTRGTNEKQRAYACTDPMEYFAELSTAFLGGLDGNQEYNKWFPFNRSQLKEYDPRAYDMLQKVWKVHCSNDQE